MMTDYTVAQRAAIASLDRPLQIVACAGSGKTQVISQRIADILARPGVAPRNVVGFTFTEKAAAELKDRVLTIVEQGGRTTGLAEMYIGTMHGYALDLVQRLVPETFKYQVLTEITARLFVDRNSKRSGLTECPTLSGGTPTLRRYVNSRLYLQAMSVLREDEVDVELVPDGVLAAYTKYAALLAEHAYFDYTQMINLAVAFLESDPDDGPAEKAVLDHVRDDLRYVVVDEYQDVNPLQERLIQGLVRYGANLCVVGDDDQTIYQWRGSEVSNIVTFADRHDDVEQVVLADNFRSSRGVVELGASIAARIPAGERLAKDMVAAGHQEWARGDLLALTFDSPDAEAEWICDRIEAMRGLAFADRPNSGLRGLAWSDFAVLFRSVAKDADHLVAELRARGIPYMVKGLNRLFDAPEIAAVVGIFDYMVAGIDAETLHQLWTDADLVADDARWPVAVAVLDAGRDFDRGARWGVYNIQRLFLDFLEALDLREDTLPGEASRRELVFYQLGKFSQAISDFETIHFASTPYEKYTGFAKWLAHQAPDYYAESDADVGYATPDAVTLSTVHQAKGMQWPAVFVPCLRHNRFPSRRWGGLNLLHVIPAEAIRDADRYRGTLEDETRLFYVAVTRAQKYLFATHSPGAGQFAKRSEFLDHCTRNSFVSTRDPGVPADTPRLEPRPRHETPQVSLSFSELKYFFECPYSFKLRFLYGFNPPLHEALGYGKGLHDALAEVHKRAIAGDLLGPEAANELVRRHLHTPYAYPELRAALHASAVDAVGRYLTERGPELERTLHSEKQIQVHVAPGIVVDGRIDLVRRLDTNELSVVDFKSTDRAQAEDVTRDQLHVYAVGYQELTGERPDLVEVLNLDAEAKSDREQVEGSLLDSVRTRIASAGESLRTNELPRHQRWCGACERCDLVALCRSRPPDTS
ncbi:MAG: ATP-dependent helicase [Sporichthyaceae bacterium]